MSVRLKLSGEGARPFSVIRKLFLSLSKLHNCKIRQESQHFFLEVFLMLESLSFALTIGGKHIPWPHLVPAWDVWLGITRLVPAQHFHRTVQRKHSVVNRAGADEKDCRSVLRSLLAAFG